MRLAASVTAISAALLLGGSATAEAGTKTAPGTVKISIGDFNSSFTAMKKLKPVTWVSTRNMKSTVIADKYVTAAQLCAAPNGPACKAAAGID
jgi:D-xylose transport system substrate-binding protein